MPHPMKKHRFFLLLLLGLYGTLHAQGLKRHMADQYFEQLDYSKAAPIYDEIALLTVKGKKQDWNAVRLAAESNLRSNHFAKAEQWYAELEKSGQMTDEDYLRYISVLRRNGHYDKAGELIAVMHQRQPGNKIIEAYYNDKNYVGELMADSTSYTVRTLPFNTGLGDYGPAYYKDGLVYVSRVRNSGFVNRKFLWDNSYFTNVYYVTKKGKSFSRHGKMLGKPFKTKPHDGPLVFSGDGKTAVLSRNDLGSTAKGEEVRIGLYISYLDGNKWSEPEKFEYNSKDYSVSHPSLSKDGNTLYFSSDMPGGQGGTDLYKSMFANGMWSKPVNLGPGVNTAGREGFPFIADDGTLFFASDGHVGLGGLDVFKSSGDFSATENMGYPLNTRYDDFGLIVNEDGNLGYFASNRTDWIDRIYETDIKVAEFFVDGTVVMDDCNQTPVANQKVVVYNKTRNIIDSVTTDAQGNFTLQLKKSSDYVIRTGKENYRLLSEEELSTQGKIRSERMKATLQLASLQIPVRVSVSDRSAKTPLADVRLTITQKSTGKTTEVQADANGKAELVLDRNDSYTIGYRVQGYLEQQKTVNTSDKCQNELTEDVAMNKIKKGDVFVINNILYDYNKATLRPESESELNKLAGFLLENSNIKVELSSHTDSRGGDSYNKRLSQKRAQSCVDYLIRKGVAKENIVAKGYGESRLLNRCDDGVECTEEEHQQNRRTEIKILQIK
jgi:outer membrane protein OmpA-like peptidoglycan-associated protein